MSEPAESLDLLLGRLADGDRSVFPRVFRALLGPVERLCRSLLGSDADAADATQEAMQKILERASDYDKNRPALPWALAIAGWECRTIARKRTRRREAPEVDLPSGGVGDAETLFVERDLARAAREALGGLSELDRQTLERTYFEETPGPSDATERKRRQRALERLKERFRRIYGLD